MKKRLSLLALMVFLLGISFQVSYAGEFQKAPANPEFLEYMSKPQQLMAPVGAGNGLGYIPEPVDLSHINQLNSAGRLMALEGVFPSTYDLRTTGKLTPVRNQGTCGSCWTFGSHASVESLLLPAESRDFSENNLKNTHGFSWGPCDGGNDSMATAYFARWSGTINESDDPYNPSSNVSPSGLTVQKHLSKVVIIPDDINAIKQAIMDNGAVTSIMFWDDPSYNPAAHAYYYSAGTSTNHSIAIVGWDDNYSAGNFKVAPPGKGAFLIRNSWGTAWGDSGYFWISYYDTATANIGHQYYFEPTTNYTGIYQYDPLGWLNMGGYGTNTAWYANIFTAAGNEQIKAVGFYATSINESYEVYVYKAVSSTTNPRSGTLCTSTTGSFTNAGYYTVIISPCSVTAGSKFSVVVKATTPSYNFPIPTEEVLAGYSDGTTSQPGRSFTSSGGNSWDDAGGDASYPGDVCLKAFSTSASPCTYSISPTSSPAFAASGGTGSVTVTTQSGCAWTASEGLDWVTITSGSSGTGNGTVNYSVSANSGASSRIGNISIAGQTFAITQSDTVFWDVPSDYWAYDYINAIYSAGITSGCYADDPNTPQNEAAYCPENTVTRVQTAVFIVKALGVQPAATCTGTVFNDVNANMTGGEGFCKYIEKFKELNITAGCGNNNYCPDNAVTRAQMAVFITKALNELPAAACTGTVFNDVSAGMNGGEGFCRYIEKFKELNITAGCGNNNYCPDNEVTRAQMAVFLTKGFLQ